MDILEKGTDTAGVHFITLQLGNGNTFQITEVSDDTIEFRNTTHIPHPEDDLGLLITVVDYSAVEITPEG